MFQIIIDFSTTYYSLPNICLYHLHRKQWLPSLVLSRSISVVRTISKCQRATHSRQPAEGSSPGCSQAALTSSSCVQNLNIEGCCLDPLHLKPWGREVFPNTPLGTLIVSGSCPPVFLPRLRSPKACVHPALVFSHPTLEEVL